MKTGTEKSEHRKNRKALPLWPLLVIIFVIIIGSFGYRGFNFYTARLLGEMLMEIVQRETDSLYTISYDDVRFNLFTDKLTLTNFSLSLDSAVNHDQGTMASLDRRNLYEAQIPKLVIFTNRLWEIYFKRALKISGLEIERPAVDVYSFPTEATPATLSFEAGNLYTLITEYLKVFEIAKFDINRGSFNFLKQQQDKQSYYTISDLSFSLKNFALDSGRIMDSSKVWFVEEMMLNVKNQQVYLPDSVHVISFEDFIISTEPSEIAFTNVRLQPRTDTANLQLKNNRLNIYDIYLPALKITGVDFEKAYYENTLSIEGISISNPYFDVDEKKMAPVQVADSLKSEKNDLRSIVTFFFDKILVNHFNLDSALFKVNLEVGKRKQMFAIDNVSMDIRNLNVDTTTSKYRFDDNFTYFDDIDIRVENYIFQLPDSIHTLRVKEFNLSTEKSQIFLDSVTYTAKYTPYDFRQTTQKPGLYNIVVPNLVLTGVDINKVLDEQRVVVGQLNMQKPEIQLFTHKTGEKAPVQPDSLYVILTDILSSIEIENFLLEDGGFKLTETGTDGLTEVTFSHIDVNTLNLQIDSTTYLYTDQMLDADNLNIRFADSYFRLPGAQYIFTTNRGYLEGRNVRKLHLENVRLQPMSDQDDKIARVDFYADTILLENTNLRQMLNEQVYLFENIHLGNPYLRIYLNKKRVGDNDLSNQIGPSKSPFLLAQQIDVSNGKLSFFKDSVLTHSLDSTYAQFRDFEFDANKIGTLENVLHLSNLIISGNNYTYYLPDSIHVLTVDDLYASSFDATSRIRNLSIQPKKLPVNDHSVMQINVPLIEMEGYNLYNSLQDGNLSLQKLNALQPQVKLSLLPATDEKAFRLEHLPRILAPLWEVTDIEEMIIEKASVDIVQKQPTGNNLFTVENVSVQLKNFYLDSATQLNNEHFLFADQFQVDLNDYAHTLANRPDTLHIGKASWKNQHLKAENVFMSNTKTDTLPSTLQYEISFPALSLNGLQWYDAYAHQRIDVRDLQLDTPQIAIETYSTDGSKGFSFPHTYPFNPEKVISVSLQSLDMQNATIDLTMHKDAQPLQYTLQNTAMSLKNLYMDSTVSVHPNNLFFTENVHFQTENIRIKLPDSLQILELGKVGFITQDSTLFAKDVKLLPRFEKTELASHLGYQKGWLHVESDSAFLKGVNLYDLLYNQKMEARKLGINDFIVNTYKDKNYPLPEDVEQPTIRDFILNAPYYLKLDTIEMQQGHINVELLAENGEIPGQLFFENFQALALNVTNDPALIQDGIDLGLNASANIMGEALLKANFAFDMQDVNGSYVYTGSLGSMDMQNFNPILEPIALVKIRRGKIDTMNMRIEANKYYAIGSMDLYYDNLRIAILDRNKDDLPTDRSLVSFFANTFIVNANNPHFFILRKGDIYAERDPRKAIFDHWARSSLSGIISSIGSGRTKKNLKQAQHEALKEQMQAVKEKQENSENEE